MARTRSFGNAAHWSCEALRMKSVIAPAAKATTPVSRKTSR